MTGSLNTWIIFVLAPVKGYIDSISKHCKVTVIRPKFLTQIFVYGGKVCFDFAALAKLFKGICVYCYVSCLYCSFRKCKKSSFNFMFLFLIKIFVNSILNDFEHPILFFREPPGFPGIKKSKQIRNKCATDLKEKQR